MPKALMVVWLGVTSHVNNVIWLGISHPAKQGCLSEWYTPDVARLFIQTFYMTIQIIWPGAIGQPQPGIGPKP